jgi:hypothetical protein
MQWFVPHDDFQLGEICSHSNDAVMAL